jgi:hypothetical protein
MGELEENSLWYKYKSQVWGTKSEQANTVHNIMRILRSIRNDKDLLYASVPITSGKVLYDSLMENRGQSRDILMKNTMDKNYYEGYLFVNDIIKRTNKPVIYPADMVPLNNNWEQKHFQALWLSIIGEKCSEVHMQKAWEYSNGGCEELVHSFQLKLGLPKGDFIFYNTKESEEYARERLRNMKTFDHKGEIILHYQAHQKIIKSLDWIKENGFDAPKIENCKKLLEWTIEKTEQGVYQ